MEYKLYDNDIFGISYKLYDDEEVFVEVNCPHTDSDIDELWKYKPQEKQFCHFYGKDIELPRKMLTLGKTYNFNGSNPSCGEIDDFGYLSKCILLAEPQSIYNSCVINFYEDGNEYIGYHRDRTNGMSKDSTIVISSFGETRTLRLQHIASKETFDLLLPHGSRFEFSQHFNNRYKHMIVKSKKIKEKRLSITYRNMN
jgi:alkylated DNA repair dioxygenase AlkB